jgi:hypothetical protein
VSKKIVAWSVYAAAVVALLAVFVHAALFEGRAVTYFNRDWEVVRKDGKTFLTYKSGTRQPTIALEITRLDYVTRRLDCVLKIEPWDGLTVRAVTVASWEWSEAPRELGPTPEVYFVFPTAEEILSNRRPEETDRLERRFQFKVSGNPVLYPFDTYRAEVGIKLLRVTKPTAPSGKPALDYIRVTTRVQESLADFHMTDQRHELTFQEEARKSNVLEENTFSFTFVRDRFLRSFTVYIYAIALGALIYIGFSRSPGELVGGALGYFAALWGLRNIIAGKIEVFPTVVDYITLLLFSLLVIIVIGRFLHMHLAGTRPLAGS